MATDREMVLEQALVAAFGAAKDLGIDQSAFYKKSMELVQQNRKYVELAFPHVSKTHDELESAWGQFKTIEGK